MGDLATLEALESWGAGSYETSGGLGEGKYMDQFHGSCHDHSLSL